MMRTWKHRLESQLKTKIPKGHPIMSWLTVWVTGLLNKFAVGPKGKTPYEIVTGHKCKHLVIPFGEKVLFRLAPEKAGRDKIETEWCKGVFVGVITRTTEFVVVNKEGIYKRGTMR